MPDNEIAVTGGLGLGPSRARVLAVLQDAARPMTAHEVGDRLGMHPNSVRFHLDALAAGGAVVRDREARSTPGRPSVTYAATAAPNRDDGRHFPLLARLLADSLHTELADPAAATERAGRRWARDLPLPDRPDRAATEAEALELLTESVDAVGFESRTVDDDTGLRVEVTRCPFLEVAADFEPEVCGLHLGLMRGVLERVQAPVEIEGLEPLVEPGLCRARLAR